jgi:hypothetical protein
MRAEGGIIRSLDARLPVAQEPYLDGEVLEVAEPQPRPVPVLVPDLYLRQVPPDARKVES